MNDFLVRELEGAGIMLGITALIGWAAVRFTTPRRPEEEPPDESEQE